MPTTNEITTVVQGYVGTEVDFVHLGNTPKATFRLGSTSRYFDRAHDTWADRPTTWLRVECWRSLAQHVAASLHKGEPVLVRGRLRTSEWMDADGARQSRLYLEADLVGHDLTRGTSSFARADGGGAVRGEQQELSRPSGPDDADPSDPADEGHGAYDADGTARSAAAAGAGTGAGGSDPDFPAGVEAAAVDSVDREVAVTG